MTTFLLIVSLFLNIIALLAIINLYLRQNRLIEVENKQEKMITDMEEVISSYLVQMKEENENFINRMKKVEIRATDNVKNLDKSSVTEANNVEQEKKDENLAIRTGKVSVSKAVNAYRLSAKTANVRTSTEDVVELPSLEMNKEQNDNISPEKKADDFLKTNEFQEQLLVNQVLSLKKQGLAEEEIARKLNRGKTEIALILKFNQNQ